MTHTATVHTNTRGHDSDHCACGVSSFSTNSDSIAEFCASMHSRGPARRLLAASGCVQRFPFAWHSDGLITISSGQTARQLHLQYWRAAPFQQGVGSKEEASSEADPVLFFQSCFTVSSYVSRAKLAKLQRSASPQGFFNVAVPVSEKDITASKLNPSSAATIAAANVTARHCGHCQCHCPTMKD